MYPLFTARVHTQEHVLECPPPHLITKTHTPFLMYNIYIYIYMYPLFTARIHTQYYKNMILNVSPPHLIARTHTPHYKNMYTWWTRAKRHTPDRCLELVGSHQRSPAQFTLGHVHTHVYTMNLSPTANPPLLPTTYRPPVCPRDRLQCG